MSKIEFEQISENEVEVVIPPETPMELVQQLTKSFHARGLVEDLQKSTLSVRYFYRPDDKANTVADELIKSLQKLSKEDEHPYWHPKTKMQNQARVRNMEVASRRAKVGIPKPPAQTTPAPAGTSVLPGVTPKIFDPAKSGKVNYTKKNEDHVEGCQCNDCLEMEKSGYGPKGTGQYSSTDNARRKAKNTGETAGVGPNVNAKAYSTKPGQMSGKAQADLTSRIQAAANKKQPVKHWTPEEIAAENVKRGLKKSWGQHLPFPSAEEEIMKLAGVSIPTGDDAAANQLANLMAGKKMLGAETHPMVRAMMTEPPAQPTNEQLFGHLIPSDNMIKSSEDQWQNGLNNFFTEAAKPLSARFASEEEEVAYWNSIKVQDKDDGRSGY